MDSHAPENQRVLVFWPKSDREDSPSQKKRKLDSFSPHRTVRVGYILFPRRYENPLWRAHRGVLARDKLDDGEDVVVAVCSGQTENAVL